MNCPRPEDISAYSDREITHEARTRIESHLKVCASCAAMLAEMQSLHAAFSRAERYPAPFAFSTRVIARATAGRKRSSWTVPAIVRFAEAAILLLVITAGILTGKVMMNGDTAGSNASVASSFSLELFDAVPPGSLGNAYLAMTESGHEK